jgi:hypothetical protein
MLIRVRRLEIVKASPILRRLGSFDEFEAEVQAGIDGGRYDPFDMPVVLACVKRWVKDGL